VNPVKVGQVLYAVLSSGTMHEFVVDAETINGAAYVRFDVDGAIVRPLMDVWYETPAAAASATIAKLRDDASRLNHRADVLAEKHLGGAA